MRGLLFALLAACSYTPEVAPGSDGSPIPPDGPLAPDSMVTIDTATDTVTGPFLAGFTHRLPITITRATGTEVLSDFPLAIVIANNTGLAANALDSGADLVVTSDDALTRLDSQLVGFDGNTGRTELWVRIPSLSAGTTSLFLYYGATAQSTDPGGVWPAQFRGVWHLSEGTGSSAADSTAAAHTLDQGIVAAIPGHAAGIAGFARSTDSVDDFITVADPADGSLDFGTASFSYSIWVNANANLGAFDQPFYKGGTTSGLPGYCMMLGTGGWAGKLHDGSSFRDIDLSGSPTLNQWHHLAIVIDRGNNLAKGYFDGNESASINFTLGSIDADEEVRVGRGSGGAQFSGLTDEARIISGVLTPDWIATEHANLATPGFVAVGTEQTP